MRKEKKREAQAYLKQSMCMVDRDLYSSSISGLNPISSYMLIPCTLALASTKGKSKLSPLYVAMTVGLESLICSNHLRITAGLVVGKKKMSYFITHGFSGSPRQVR